jgi:hypothetical protein
VKDPTGALISTATVKATNLDTGFTETAKSNSYGEYRIDYLPVGKIHGRGGSGQLQTLCAGEPYP